MATNIGSSSPAVPSSSRLVSKLCVHGRVPASAASSTNSDARLHPSAAAATAGLDGVRIDLYCKVNLPLVGGSHSYPLFPDQRVRLLSSSTYPLSQHASLVLTPPPPAAILEAAKCLRVGTTFDPPSSSSSVSGTRAQPTVKVAVQDFAVCLLTEGAAGVSSANRRGKGGGRSSTGSFSPTPHGGGAEGGCADSAPWIVVMELFVPWLSSPPLDRTSILIPLPRCLSNTLAFHLLLPPQDPDVPSSDAEEYSFMTSPKLLTSAMAAAAESDGAGASPDDLVLQGTFQSTPQLEIRWCPVVGPTSLESSSASASLAGAVGKGSALLRAVEQAVEWTVKAPTSGDDSSNTLVLGLKAEIEGDLHYAGVESIASLDAALSLPPSSSSTHPPIEWVQPPTFSADRGLGSFYPLPTTGASVSIERGGDQAEADDASFDTTTTSTVQSPSPSHARVRQHQQPPSQKSSFSRSTSGESATGGQSSSLPSLLRQQLPTSSAAADLTSADISFAAFDNSTQPTSPGASPRMKHRSPLGPSSSSSASLDLSRRRRRATGAEDDGRTSRAWRVSVEVSKVHESGLRWRLNWSGEVGLAVGEDGKVVLPNVGVSATDGSFGQGRVSIKAPAGWDVGPPEDATRVAPSSSSKVKSWDVPPPIGPSSPSYFTVARSAPSTLAGAVASSPHHGKPSIGARHRRRASSLVSTFSPPSGSGPTGVLAPDPDSPFWVGHATEAGEALPHVDLETFLLLTAVGEAAGVQQLTSMTVVLPLLAPGQSEEPGEDDTFEFGIVAGPTTALSSSSSPRQLPSVRVLSATVNAVPVPWDLQLPSSIGDAEEAAIPGALGYVQLQAAGLRAVGGEVRVKYIVEHPASVASSRWWARQTGEVGLVLGLPSFEEGVAWAETSVAAVEGSSVHVLASSATLVPLARSTRHSPVRLMAHSLPPLSTSHLRIALHPAPLGVADRRPSGLSWSTIAAVLLTLWLLASVGLEVRDTKERLGVLALRVQQSVGESRQPDTVMAPTSAGWGFDPTSSPSPVNTEPDDSASETISPSDPPTESSSTQEVTTTTGSSAVLRPTFIPIPPPPTPSTPAPIGRPTDALAWPHVVFFPALQGVFRRADGVLEATAVGRGLRSIVVGLGRAVAWIVLG